MKKFLMLVTLGLLSFNLYASESLTADCTALNNGSRLEGKATTTQTPKTSSGSQTAGL